MQMRFYFRHLMMFMMMLFLLQPGTTSSQQVHNIPRNFPGLLAAIEWNTISGVTGLGYERSLFSKQNVVVGFRGTYIFPYRSGNMQLLNEPCCDVSTIATGMATANLFTSNTRYQSGFFLEAGAGLGYKSREFEQGLKETSIRPAVEAGFGWLFPLGSGLAVKWSNTVTFPSKQAGITMTRLAFGF